MNRRELITLLGGATAVWPLAAGAQQAMPVIGFLSSRSPGESKHLVDAFRAGLQTLGYVEGHNVAIHFRWAEGQYDRLPAMAAELVREFSLGGDPVKAGLVASLNRPGGNATGVSLLTFAPEAKRLGLLHEVVPNAEVIGALINPDYQGAEDQWHEVQDAARAIDRRVERGLAASEQELEPAFAALVQKRVAALLVTADPFFDTRRDRIVALMAQFKLPTMYQFRDYAVAGGLMSYGISISDGYRQVGVYTGQVLKGAKPADLPVQQSIRFEFVINMKTAKALGLSIPDKLLALADEVIE